MKRIGVGVFFILIPLIALSGSLVKVVHHQKGQIYSFSLSHLYATRFRFHHFGSIKAIYCGDPTGWEIQVSQSQDAVIVKPRLKSTSTNLIIDFRDRSVLINVSVAVSSVMQWLDVEFYPSIISRNSSRKNKTHHFMKGEYVFHGDRALMPAWAIDDGRFTYLQWAPTTAIPAVYRATTDGVCTEMVNYRVKKGSFILNSVEPAWCLRRGGMSGILRRAPRHTRGQAE